MFVHPALSEKINWAKPQDYNICAKQLHWKQSDLQITQLNSELPAFSKEIKLKSQSTWFQLLNLNVSIGE